MAVNSVIVPPLTQSQEIPSAATTAHHGSPAVRSRRRAAATAPERVV